MNPQALAALPLARRRLMFVSAATELSLPPTTQVGLSITPASGANHNNFFVAVLITEDGESETLKVAFHG